MAGRDEPNPRDIAVAAVREAFYANDDYGIDGGVLADAVLSALTQAGLVVVRASGLEQGDELAQAPGYRVVNSLTNEPLDGLDVWVRLFRVADGSRPA